MQGLTYCQCLLGDAVYRWGVFDSPVLCLAVVEISEAETMAKLKEWGVVGWRRRRSWVCVAARCVHIRLRERTRAAKYLDAGANKECNSQTWSETAPPLCRPGGARGDGECPQPRPNFTELETPNWFISPPTDRIRFIMCWFGSWKHL